jgi:hypothetical protein
MTADNARLCQETAIRMLHPYRSAFVPRGTRSAASLAHLIEVQDKLIFDMCRLGFTAAEVAAYIEQQSPPPE